MRFGYILSLAFAAFTAVKGADLEGYAAYGGYGYLSPVV
jgi:hypothetical protein